MATTVSRFERKHAGYFERLVRGTGDARRDPDASSKFLCNNLFGLFKGRIGKDKIEDLHGVAEDSLER